MWRMICSSKMLSIDVCSCNTAARIISLACAPASRHAARGLRTLSMVRRPALPEPIILKFVRCHINQIAIFVDSNLDWWSLSDLREWAGRGVMFTVIDADTDEDMTRIVLA
jgi:hypothetical protein